MAKNDPARKLLKEPGSGVQKRYHNLHKIGGEMGGYGGISIPFYEVKSLEGVMLPEGVVEEKPGGADVTALGKDKGKIDAFFYLAALLNGLTLPFSKFIRDVLKDFGVEQSQLIANAWRVLFVLYCHCQEEDWQLSSKVFRALYEIQKGGAWYFFMARGVRIVRGLPQSHKGRTTKQCGWYEKGVRGDAVLGHS